MAGSYAHCSKDDGTFREDEDDFKGMIENLGDAYEACHMMHWMIGFLAAEMSGGTGVPKEHLIKIAQDAYYRSERAKYEITDSVSE